MIKNLLMYRLVMESSSDGQDRDLKKFSRQNLLTKVFERKLFRMLTPNAFHGLFYLKSVSHYSAISSLRFSLDVIKAKF